MEQTLAVDTSLCHGAGDGASEDGENELHLVVQVRENCMRRRAARDHL